MRPKPNPAVRLHFENPSHYKFYFIHLKFIFFMINDRIAASQNFVKHSIELSAGKNVLKTSHWSLMVRKKK